MKSRRRCSKLGKLIYARGGLRGKAGRGGSWGRYFWIHLADAPGQAGDLEYFNENDGRVGKRRGTYGALDSKFALPYTFADDWWLAGPSSSQGLRPFQNVMFVRRPITSSFLIRWVGSFGLAIPAPGLMTYWRSG
jgi:hypothetical protein